MTRDSKTLLVRFIAITSLAMLTSGCAMFATHDEDPLPPPAPAKPTTVPVDADTSTPMGMAKELFVDLPKRLSDFMSGRTATNAVMKMEDAHPDNRRAGIADLTDRDYGKQAPYTDRYQQIASFDTSPLVRSTAIRALNRSRDGSAAKLFVNALTDESELVRLEGAKALSNVPTELAIPALIKLVNNPAENVDVRIAGAEALRHYRSLEVARSLVNLLGERDFGLAWQARQSLRFMTGADRRYDQTAWLNYLTTSDAGLG